MTNSVDPDETPRSAASHLGLYCLLRPVGPITCGKYGTFFINLCLLLYCVLVYTFKMFLERQVQKLPLNTVSVYLSLKSIPFR